MGDDVIDQVLFDDVVEQMCLWFLCEDCYIVVGMGFVFVQWYQCLLQEVDIGGVDVGQICVGFVQFCVWIVYIVQCGIGFVVIVGVCDVKDWVVVFGIVCDGKDVVVIGGQDDQCFFGIDFFKYCIDGFGDGDGVGQCVGGIVCVMGVVYVVIFDYQYIVFVVFGQNVQ